MEPDRQSQGYEPWMLPLQYPAIYLTGRKEEEGLTLAKSPCQRKPGQLISLFLLINDDIPLKEVSCSPEDIGKCFQNLTDCMFIHCQSYF